MAKRLGIFFGGVLIGGAVGTAIGLLTAPRPGRDTRRILKKSADALPEVAGDISSSVQFQAGRLSASTADNWSNVNWDSWLDRLRAAVAAGVAASQTELQTLRARQTASDTTDRRDAGDRAPAS